jgi:hypothetical protein
MTTKLHLLALMTLIAVLTACKQHNEPVAVPAMPPSQVTVQVATPQSVDVSMEYTGQIAGVRDAEVRARVTGVLLRRNYVEGAVVKAGHNAALNGLTNCRFLAADAEQIFAQVTSPAEATAVIIDPPRAGCSEAFLTQLLAFRPKTLVYVSCNPATQMRDLKQLNAGGYALRRVQPFDLFPQTAHVECVAILRRAD